MNCALIASLTIRSDETPHQRAQRSFVEIHFYGQYKGTQEAWCEVVKGIKYSVPLLTYF
jgi:hypothetical protein